MDSVAIAAAATVTARTVRLQLGTQNGLHTTLTSMRFVQAYILAGGDASDNIVANASLIAELTVCLTESWRCELIERFLPMELEKLSESSGTPVTLDLGTSPPSYYTSVVSASSGLPLVEKNGRISSLSSSIFQPSVDKVRSRCVISHAPVFGTSLVS